MATICSTPFKAGRVPEATLRQIMQKHDMEPDLRIAMADVGLLTCALTAALGDTAADALAEFLLLIPVGKPADDTPDQRPGPWPSSEAAVTMNKVKLRAIHQECKQQTAFQAQAMAKVVDDPTKVPTISEGDYTVMRTKFITAHPELRFDQRVEPHRRLIETIKRDILLHGRIPVYEVTVLWVRGDGTLPTAAHINKTLDDVLRITQSDKEIAVRTDEQCLDRITALMYALEFLGVMALETKSSRGYLAELRDLVWQHPGIEYIHRADQLFRTQVDKRCRDDPSLMWNVAFEDTLANRRDLWAQSVCEVTTMNLVKAAQGPQAPGTPVKRQPDHSAPGTPAKRSRGASQRHKQKQLLEAYKANIGIKGAPPPPPSPARQHSQPAGAQAGPKGKGKGKKGAAKGSIPDAEFQKLLTLRAQNNAGVPICRWYNSSLGCTRPGCKFSHECSECGQGHPYAGHH